MRKHWLWNWFLYTGFGPQSSQGNLTGASSGHKGKMKELVARTSLSTSMKPHLCNSIHLTRILPLRVHWALFVWFKFLDFSDSDFHKNEWRPHTICRLPDNGLPMHYGTYLFLDPLISCKVHPKVQFIFHFVFFLLLQWATLIGPSQMFF